MSSTFDNTVLLIKTFNSLPTGHFTVVGTQKVYGWSAADIFAQLNSVLPGSGLSLADVTSLLAAGAKKGIFNIVGCIDNVPAYWLNPSMVQSNWANIAYLRACANYNGFAPGPIVGFTGGTFVEGSPSASTANFSCANQGSFAGAVNFTPGGVTGLGNSSVSLSSCP